MITDDGAIAKALDAYKNDIGKYPDTGEGLQVLFQKKASNKEMRFNGPYLNGTYDRSCKDPWGSYCEYRFPSKHNDEGYDLWSCGPNRRNEGGKEGSDDIKNWSEK